MAIRLKRVRTDGGRDLKGAAREKCYRASILWAPQTDGGAKKK